MPVSRMTYVTYYPPAGHSPRAVTSGAQLTVNDVGPWALQNVAPGAERLDTSLTVPPRGFWRFDTPSEFIPAGTWPANANDANPAVLNNPALIGGTVGSSPVTIDGYLIPAGTSIAQFRVFPDNGTTGFCDFYAHDTSLKVLFRGCRFRSAYGVGGSSIFNDGGTALAGQQIMMHYSDVGLTSLDPPATSTGLMHAKFLSGTNHRWLRNYHTISATYVQPNVVGVQVVENWIDNYLFAYGEQGPLGDGNPYHINGVSINGGLDTLYILRNHILAPSPDGATGSTGFASGQIGYGTQSGQNGYGSGTAPGRLVVQTDNIGLFISPNNVEWTGSDVQVRNNLIGGSGYPMYAYSTAGQQTNLKITGNMVTTRWWTNGGQAGSINWGTGPPIVNGVNGCELSGNIWYDDYGTGGDGTTAVANRQYPAGNGPRAGTTVF